MIPAVLLLLLLVSAVLVWIQPDSADYVALCLTKRARALRAARSAYREAWDGGSYADGGVVTKPTDEDLLKWYREESSRPFNND